MGIVLKNVKPVAYCHIRPRHGPKEGAQEVVRFVKRRYNFILSHKYIIFVGCSHAAHAPQHHTEKA